MLDFLFGLVNLTFNCFLDSAKYDLVHIWVDAGITEALDDIQVTHFPKPKQVFALDAFCLASFTTIPHFLCVQYSGGGSSGGDRNSLGEVAAALVEQIYHLLEQEEGEDHSSLPPTVPHPNGVDTSSHPVGGIPTVGSHHSLSHSPFAASSSAQPGTYAFGATAPSPTVFSFDGPSSAPPNTLRSIGSAPSFGSVGGANSANNLAALGAAPAHSPFNSNNHPQFPPSNGNSGSSSPVPQFATGGMGRGSHINKPAWMN